MVPAFQSEDRRLAHCIAKSYDFFDTAASNLSLTSNFYHSKQVSFACALVLVLLPLAF